MSKALINRRDKMLWDNSNKPDISDVVAEIDDEMDDLLDDHDDKIVDIVGDNMNDLLDDHDDKVVSIVGDNMVTLLRDTASTVQLIAGDKSGITTTPVRVGKWDATHDIYAARVTGTFVASESNITITLYSGTDCEGVIQTVGIITRTNGVSSPVDKAPALSASSAGVFMSVASAYSEGTYDIIFYFLKTITPTT